MPPDRFSGKSVWSLWTAGGLIVAYIGLLNLLGSQIPVPRPSPRASVPLPTDLSIQTCEGHETPSPGTPAPNLPRRDVFQWAGAHPASPPAPEAPPESVVRRPAGPAAVAWVLLGVLQSGDPPLSVWQSGTDIQTLRAGDRLADGIQVREVRPDGVVLAWPGGRTRYLRVGEAFRP